MARFEDTTTIHAPVERVYEFMKDVGRLWACFPDVAIRDVVLTPEGVGSRAEWYVRMLFLHYGGHVELIEAVPNERIVVESTAGPVFTFTLTPRDDGDTEVGCAVEWISGVPVVGRAVENVGYRMGMSGFLGFVANIRAAVEGVQSEPVQPPRQERRAATLTRSITIDAPVDAVFDHVLEIGTFWAGADGVALREVRRTPDGVGTTARLYSFLGPFHLEGDLEIVEAVPGERIAAQVHFGPESPLWTFTFAPADGGTLLTGQGEWHMNVPGVGRRLATMEANSHGELLEQILAKAKERVEAESLVMQ